MTQGFTTTGMTPCDCKSARYLFAAIGIATYVGVSYATALLLPTRPQSFDGLTVHTVTRRWTAETPGRDSFL